MTIEQFTLDFQNFSTSNGNIFRTTVHYIINQHNLTLEISDMLDFINDNIMYFVLGYYNIGINIIFDNKIKTYGIGEKNIFIFMRQTSDNAVEYYPVFIK
jgi:hypothetical protein